MSKLAKRIVKVVEKELNSRRGVGFDHLDKAIQKEIRSSLERVIDETLDKTSSEEFTSGE